MLLKDHEEYRIEHSMEAGDLFESIAKDMQDEDELGLSYDDILEQLESNSDLNGYIDVIFSIVIDTKKKTITAIY